VIGNKDISDSLPGFSVVQASSGPGLPCGHALPLGPGPACTLARASGRRRPDERYFCWIGLHASARYTVTISRYLQSDDERTQPQRSQSAQRTHRDFLSGYCGTLDPLPILNHMVIPLPPLARSRLPGPWQAGCPPGRASLAWQALPHGLGPACTGRARVRAQEAGRASSEVAGGQRHGFSGSNDPGAAYHLLILTICL